MINRKALFPPAVASTLLLMFSGHHYNVLEFGNSQRTQNNYHTIHYHQSLDLAGGINIDILNG